MIIKIKSTPNPCRYPPTRARAAPANWRGRVVAAGARGYLEEKEGVLLGGWCVWQRACGVGLVGIYNGDICNQN